LHNQLTKKARSDYALAKRKYAFNEVSRRGSQDVQFLVGSLCL